MRRLKGDRGAVAVMVALLMIPVLACTALVVDVGALYLRRSELQNAADAGALAIAQDCAGPFGCGPTTDTANTYALLNAGTGASANATVGPPSSVTVKASSIVRYMFASAIGFPPKLVTATSTASWASPVAGRTMLPVVFSWCSFLQQTGGGLPTVTTKPIEVKFAKKDGTVCYHSGNPVPGGFGWLKVDDGSSCSVTSSVSNRVYSDPGAKSPCGEGVFSDRKGSTVLLPLFVDADRSGTNAWYQVYGYAAFWLTDYDFHGSHNSIFGYFVKFVESSDAFTYGAGAPDLGARVVSLTG